MSQRFTALLLLGLLFFSSCRLERSELCRPLLTVPITARSIQQLSSAFPNLTQMELLSDWGKELKVARSFGREFDLYRSITFYKRALVLMPCDELHRRQEAEYSIILCYYLGDKFSDAITAFENSSLDQVSGSEFPAFEDLLIILEDSYRRVCENHRADQIIEIIRRGDAALAAELETAHSLARGDLACAVDSAPTFWRDEIEDFQDSYSNCCLNPCRAQALQAVLPGAGYWYVGQRQSGLTSLLVNAAFIAAAWHFFDDGNWGAAAVTTSLEFGWYIGGIYGAGLAAERKNENWYDCNARPFIRDRNLAPGLMLQFSF